MKTAVTFLFDTLNLLKEQLLNLLITLIVVDRLLEWRERRKWRRVRHLVELQLEAGLGDFLRSFARWLGRLKTVGNSVNLSKTALSVLAERALPAKATLPADDFEEFVALCAGHPIPAPGEPAFIDAVQPRAFHKELFGHLVTVSLDADDASWNSLVSELQALVPRLASLMERIPEKAQPSGSLDSREFLESLHILTRKVDPSLYDRHTWDTEESLLDRAESIAFSVVGAIMWIKVLRTSFRAES